MTTIAARPGGLVVSVLLGDDAWPDVLENASRLAARTGRRLRVVLADGGDLVAAAALDCVSLVGAGGTGLFDPSTARRQLAAFEACLRRELQLLARRLGINAELVAAASTIPPWRDAVALTVFGRRQSGTLLVVHAGTPDSLELAAHLARERRQAVRLLSTMAEPTDDYRRLFGPYLTAPPETIGSDMPLVRPSDIARVATLVLDPAWIEARQLTLEALLAEIRSVMSRRGS